MSEPRNNSNKKRSVRIAGHDTSITIEDDFWSLLKEIAKEQKRSLSDLITEIDEKRGLDVTLSDANLSSMLRVYALNYLQNKIAKTAASTTETSHQ